VPLASGRLSEKLPSASVVVPLVVPFTSTVTPGTAAPSGPVTRPVTGTAVGASVASRAALGPLAAGGHGVGQFLFPGAEGAGIHVHELVLNQLAAVHEKDVVRLLQLLQNA
nr:hypothetical protein [Tanacetum cinerariifolium]